MESFRQDVRYGLRVLLKSPGFTAVAVLALALGIGANTAIFSVVNAVLLRDLPYQNPSRLVMVWEKNSRKDMNVVSPANFFDWQEQNTVFEQMALFIDFRFNLTGLDQPEELPGQIATVNLFEVVGASPLMGRTFLPEDGQQGHENVVILSHSLWQRRFAGDPNVVGRKITLQGQDNTVIGVMPADFHLYIKQASMVRKPVDIWLPVRSTSEWRVRRGRAWMSIARLKPEVTLDQAQSEMTAMAARFEEQYPDFNKGWGVNLVPLRAQLSGELRTALLILLGAVGFVLLIACANVANLLLARAAARQKEMAIRVALGAGRRRILRQLLTESVLLSIVGGGTGLLLAMWGTSLLVSLSPRDLLNVSGVGVDRRVLLFTMAVSIVTGLIFGIAPAIAASRINLNEALKEGGRDSSSGSRGQKLRSAFVVVEVALALILLVGSGLMIRSLMRLQSVDPGFDPARLLTARLILPGARYQKDEQRIQFFKQLASRLETLPGVTAATAIDWLPFAGAGSATGFTIEGEPTPEPGQFPVCEVRVTLPNFFDAMKIPFIAGRTYSERESTDAYSESDSTKRTHVVVINQTMAAQHFAGQNPLGKRVRIEMMDDPAPCEIIGVVADSKHSSLDGEVRATAYWPHPELARGNMTMIVRADSDPAALAGAVRSEVLAMDKDQPIADVRTMESLLSESIGRTRFTAVLLAVFAVVALVLASVGIYGVMAYSVEQRTHEIGIRMALGADQGSVVGLIVRRGMLLSTAGIVIGLGGAYALTRFLETLVYQVSTTDLTSFALVTGVLLVVGLVACLIPARRATRVDPMIALRYE
jgi:putative ABC transport system permease protein